MLGLLFYVLYIVVCDTILRHHIQSFLHSAVTPYSVLPARCCDTILSPSCTVLCPGATESLVLLSPLFEIYTQLLHIYTPVLYMYTTLLHIHIPS